MCKHIVMNNKKTLCVFGSKDKNKQCQQIIKYSDKSTTQKTKQIFTVKHCSPNQDKVQTYDQHKNMKHEKNIQKLKEV